MLRDVGVALVLVSSLAGCGARPVEPLADPAAMLAAWQERVQESDSVRFDVSVKSEGRQSWGSTTRGSMSPMPNGVYVSDRPLPTAHLAHRVESYHDGRVLEFEAVDRVSDVYLRHSRLAMPAGKSWVKLELGAASWVANEDTTVSLTFQDIHPDGVFRDLDRSSLTISAGQQEQLDGVAVTRYVLTAGRAEQTNPNTARGKNVTVTAWIGPGDLPVQVEQVSTGNDGNTNRRTSRYTDWNSTPMVELPPAAAVASAREVTWTGR